MMKLEMGGDELSLLQFVVDMTKALAWPLTVMFVVWLFRRSLAKLANEVAKFEGLGMRIDFKREVEKLADAVEQVTQEKPVQGTQEKPVADTASDKPPLYDEASLSGLERLVDGLADLKLAVRGDKDERPRGVIFSAWRQIEAALGALADRNGISIADRHGKKNIAQLALALQNLGVMSGEVGRLVDQARLLRNAAAHEANVSFDMVTARDYANLAEVIVQELTTADSGRE